ncbi:sigma 54-interacting transcriptional regulator [Clostridium tarantellae]|uniref:HTH-type transcriptional regulatory protein TyrR n=1 Tax=Clostridium tarantellae TaxID=39493 RepID=A0A6I1MJQ0_9CLOT|nr:sigma 54-interacting transcriptional regulator [Clostridium tarantellae]MPQ43756.1 PAS domain S-box protein [Clostridium tarantellae]
MFYQEITIKNPLGIHTRFSAMIINKASEISYKYKLNLYIRKKPYKDWLGMSMLALLSLRVINDDIICIGCKEEGLLGKLAVNSLLDYINEIINTHTKIEEVDKLICESQIANEQVLENVPIGIIVIDLYQNIININDYSLKLIGKSYDDVIGKPILEALPTINLTSIVDKKLKLTQFGEILHVNNKIALVNSTPLFINDKIIGAVSVIQDVSDLVGMKEINEKFKKILENSQDMICFLDEQGKVNYVNPAYIKTFANHSKDIIGKDINEISPYGFRAKAFNKKMALNDVIHHKEGIKVISNIEPLFIDNEFKGVISTSKPINVLKDIIYKLNKSEEELNYYKKEFLKQISKDSSFKDIIGFNRTLHDMIYICQKASESTSTVLVRGESGTGKELIAKAIHNNSNRKDKPFVRVNCAAIPENLLESELFGYEKGAFTGAIKEKPGKFAIADSGTIFLDEIGDMPLSMQVKLLRVLQEREIERIGAIHSQKIDVRVIAATNRNLEKMMKESTFREDLYYRLNVLAVNLPPLRERKEDIPPLIEHFIKKLNNKLNKNILGIDKDALSLLEEYSWPGNIRELENIIERCMNFCDEKYISSAYLPSYMKPLKKLDYSLNLDENNILTFEEYEKQIIELAMKKYKTYNKAGKALGLTHRTISLKCKKYNINISKP